MVIVPGPCAYKFSLYVADMQRALWNVKTQPYTRCEVHLQPQWLLLLRCPLVSDIVLIRLGRISLAPGLYFKRVEIPLPCVLIYTAIATAVVPGMVSTWKDNLCLRRYAYRNQMLGL
jgi:hypothetical protein